MYHSIARWNGVSPRPLSHKGFSLIELLVAIAIGAVLIFGATQAYVDSRNAYTINEAVARMQETGRYAMAVMEADISMSNFWGLKKGSVNASVRKTEAPNTALGGAAATKCGANYALDLEQNIEGTEGTYSLGCDPYHNKAMPNADTVTVRRASERVSATTPVAGPLRICSTRTAAVLVNDTSVSGSLCEGALIPENEDEALGPTGEIHDLSVSAYYVDQDSDQQNGLPSLRRWYLTTEATGPTFAEAEVVPGIEDMQIQYGVDRLGGFGPSAGVATQYLNAGTTLDALLTATPAAQIVSVRVWLLVRAETPEVGFADNRDYEYGSRLASNGYTSDLTVAADANKAYRPSLSPDNSLTSVKSYRRILISRTISLRNALGT